MPVDEEALDQRNGQPFSAVRLWRIHQSGPSRRRQNVYDAGWETVPSGREELLRHGGPARGHAPGQSQCPVSEHGARHVQLLGGPCPRLIRRGTV